MEPLHIQEMEGKQAHDSAFPLPHAEVDIHRPIIVGAGPSGIAVAACLKAKGIDSLVLERSDCIASLWQHRAYDRLRLHLPKRYCELPLAPYPPRFPTYPTKPQFVAYVESYARRFDVQPVFRQNVVCAEHDGEAGLWRVKTAAGREYAARFLVVATGENADVFVPKIEGYDKFSGPVLHTSSYKSGEAFRGKKVLVVGCGNSGMEVCLDLCDYDASPHLVVRNALPIRGADRLLLLAARLILGDTAHLGLPRPLVGPLELKSLTGKAPVLDVRPAIKRLRKGGAEFSDGRAEDFEAIVLATGYKSSVPTWLKERKMFSEEDGFPRRPFPNSWKGEKGLYAVGFTKRGLLGAGIDARKIAADIERNWRTEKEHPTPAVPEQLLAGVEQSSGST
ncbi:hypothetical protein HPP92_005181 [Vanilla planifolia]|uniref:indole-3-pyruvate monooxygenase n=1 Tax=Vanilla planifolia TaxID=51239 RepID=A0A835V944_VANPL|nr:hypothetical protein HPP92_005482 [Vanilla planifolia]KAG0494187.1 hypothetical protein HPP92_005181 [Vanilla planifolia]